MAPLTVHADSAAQAFARAGEAILRRTADVTLCLPDYQFAGKAYSLGLDGMDQVSAEPRSLVVIVLRQDVDAAPVDLFDGAEIGVGQQAHRIARRTEQAELGHVTFLLDPLP